MFSRIIFRLCSYLPQDIGDPLYMMICHPKAYRAQRKRDREMYARFEAFCQSRGLKKVKGEWVKE